MNFLHLHYFFNLTASAKNCLTQVKTFENTKKYSCQWIKYQVNSQGSKNSTEFFSFPSAISLDGCFYFFASKEDKTLKIFLFKKKTPSLLVGCCYGSSPERILKIYKWHFNFFKSIKLCERWEKFFENFLEGWRRENAIILLFHFLLDNFFGKSYLKDFLAIFISQ